MDTVECFSEQNDPDTLTCGPFSVTVTENMTHESEMARL